MKNGFIVSDLPKDRQEVIDKMIEEFPPEMQGEFLIVFIQTLLFSYLPDHKERQQLVNELNRRILMAELARRAINKGPF